MLSVEQRLEEQGEPFRLGMRKNIMKLRLLGQSFKPNMSLSLYGKGKGSKMLFRILTLLFCLVTKLVSCRERKNEISLNLRSLCEIR